eukprot:5394474-Pleurochrysis_carterae.AAC.1
MLWKEHLLSLRRHGPCYEYVEQRRSANALCQGGKLVWGANRVHLKDFSGKMRHDATTCTPAAAVAGTYQQWIQR